MYNNTCSMNNTLDFSNATSLPIRLVYLPNEWILYNVIWPILTLFGTLCNSCFIWTVTRTPSLHTATYIYLVTLACTDLITIVSLGSTHVHSYFTTSLRYSSKTIDALLPILFIFTYISSTGLVTLVSLERFVAICHPLKYLIFRGKTRTCKLIGVSLLISMVCCACAQRYR